MIYPNPADRVAIRSNLYRAIENRDLIFTAMQHPILGWGFGRPFLQPIALPDISELAPYYLYIPHNTIYWVWMRLGTIGFLALWYLLGALVVRGGLIAWRLRDRYLQCAAMFVVAVTCMEILAAYADYQLYCHRNVLYLGLLAGVLMKLPSCEADQTPESPGEILGEIASATPRHAAVA
jgi:O-antigen ligase